MPIPVSVISKCIRFFSALLSPSLCSMYSHFQTHARSHFPQMAVKSVSEFFLFHGILYRHLILQTSGKTHLLDLQIPGDKLRLLPHSYLALSWLNTRRKSCESARILSAISSLSCSIACQYKESRVLYKKCGLICACRAASSLSFSCSVIT